MPQESVTMSEDRHSPFKSATIHSLRGGEFCESPEVGEDRRRSTGGPIFSEMVQDRAMKFGKA